MSDALRALFTELEFTSLLKELLPVSIEVSETNYTRSEVSERMWRACCWQREAGSALAVALET